MRGSVKLFTMLVLAAGLAVMPSMGSQGAGALTAERNRADAMLTDGAARPLLQADHLAQHLVVELASR